MEIITNLCTGCGACFTNCPTTAIVMHENELGEISPLISNVLCINCGICKRKCPQNSLPVFCYPKKCFVSFSKDLSLREFSSSGAFAAEVARYSIKNNIVIYGCDYDDNLDLTYFEIRNEDDIKKSQGSKYSQAYTGDIYLRIKEKLDSGIQVIFISTPCQISGLLASLGKKYDNLLTIDFVCHGTPPNSYLKDYIENNIASVKNARIRFRGKYDKYLTVFDGEKELYKKNHREDLYYTAFYDNIISRNSCYTCKYARPERISDITIGDFWGLGKLNNISMPENSRPSLILINTQSGELLFNLIKDSLLYEERDVAEGINGNGRLLNPPGKSLDAETFQSNYKQYGFQTAIHKSSSFKKVVYNTSSPLKKHILDILPKLRAIPSRLLHKLNI